MRREFAAMGVDVELVLDVEESPAALEALHRAELRVSQLAAILTRFDPGSELMQLNAAGAGVVSDNLFEVIALADQGMRDSGGRFDPRLERAMVRLGYDRTFHDLDASRAPAPPTAATDGAHGRVEGSIQLDAARRHVALPRGARLDLGGIAKGWIVDRVCSELGLAGPALVAAGGDIACSARADGSTWVVDVEHHVDGSATTTRTVELDWGGLATSGTNVRRWQDPSSGETVHHVLDPATGRSLDSEYSSVTVIAATCATAEVVATALLFADPAQFDAEVEAFGVTAIVTDRCGATNVHGASRG